MAAEVQVQQQQQQQQQQDVDDNSAPLSVQSAEGLEHCSLLGGTFAMFVQFALAAAAIGTLVYKRHSEKPQRPWRVWFFDASKQAYAGFLQHLVNIAFGMWFASSGAASECAWYAVNFAISVVCGVFLLWGAMRLYTRIVERFRLHYLRSGEYGNPPSWKPWLAQLLVWGVLSAAEKGLTAVVVIIPLHPILDSFAAWIEQPLLPYPALELLLVMVLAPILLNIAFFWLIDNIIMRRRGDRHTRDGHGDDVSGRDHRARTRARTHAHARKRGRAQSAAAPPPPHAALSPCAGQAGRVAAAARRRRLRLPADAGHALAPHPDQLLLIARAELAPGSALLARHCPSLLRVLACAFFR